MSLIFYFYELWNLQFFADFKRQFEKLFMVILFTFQSLSLLMSLSANTLPVTSQEEK